MVGQEVDEAVKETRRAKRVGVEASQVETEETDKEEEGHMGQVRRGTGTQTPLGLTQNLQRPLPTMGDLQDEEGNILKDTEEKIAACQRQHIITDPNLRKPVIARSQVRYFKARDPSIRKGLSSPQRDKEQQRSWTSPPLISLDKADQGHTPRLGTEKRDWDCSKLGHTTLGQIQGLAYRHNPDTQQRSQQIQGMAPDRTGQHIWPTHQGS